MTIDLSKMSGTQLTVVGTVAAAFIAVFGAVLSTLINRMTAIGIARDAARREFLTRSLARFCEGLDDTIEKLAIFLKGGPLIVSVTDRLAKALTDKKNEMKVQGVEETSTDFLVPFGLEMAKLQEQLDSASKATDDLAHLYKDTGFYAVILTDFMLADGFRKWLLKVRTFMRLVASGPFTANPETLKQLQNSATELFWQGVAFRQSINEVIFSGRPWWKRGWFYISYKVRKRLLKRHDMDE